MKFKLVKKKNDDVAQVPEISWLPILPVGNDLDTGDIIMTKTKRGTYYVEFVTVFGNVERIFVSEVHDGRNVGGYAYLPLNESYVKVMGRLG